jgi:hypothetical protein
MLQTLIKIVLTSVLVVAISEAAKRSTLAGAILASLPITSLLAMAWLYYDTRDAEKVADLASGVFWLILPSLTLLLAFPFLLRKGVPFAPSLLIGIALTALSYFLMLKALHLLGIEV